MSLLFRARAQRLNSLCLAVLALLLASRLVIALPVCEAPDFRVGQSLTAAVIRSLLRSRILIRMVSPISRLPTMARMMYRFS